MLGPTFLIYVLKWSAISIALDYKNELKNMQTAGYNGARTVYNFKINFTPLCEVITYCYWR